MPDAACFVYTLPDSATLSRRECCRIEEKIVKNATQAIKKGITGRK